MTIQVQPKLDVHGTVDNFTMFVEANAQFCAVAISNKTKLIAWYKQQKLEHIRHFTDMYDGLISNAEIELADLHKHVAILGLRLPAEVTIIDGENVNAAG